MRFFKEIKRGPVSDSVCFHRNLGTDRELSMLDFKTMQSQQKPTLPLLALGLV